MEVFLKFKLKVKRILEPQSDREKSMFQSNRDLSWKASHYLLRNQPTTKACFHSNKMHLMMPYFPKLGEDQRENT